MPMMQFAGVSFTAPDTYVDRSVYVAACASPVGPFQRNIAVNFDDLRDRSLADLVREIEAHLLKQRMPGLRLGAKGTVRVSGHEGASIEFATEDRTPQGPLHLVRRMIFVPFGTRVMVVTFTALDSDFANHVGELDAMLASMRID